MISSHDGMDARRDRPPAAFFAAPGRVSAFALPPAAAAAGGASGSAAAAGASPDPADPGSARPA